MCIDVCCNRVSYPRKEPPSRTILSWSKIVFRSTQTEPLETSWRTGTWNWPSKSLNLNPVEHLWEQMSVHISDMANPSTATAKLVVVVQQVSLCMVVTTTFTQPSRMPLIPSSNLQKWKIFRSQLVLLRTLFADECYRGTPWYQCTLPASARKLLTLA